MLIVYRQDTGEVVDNHGTNQNLPMGLVNEADVYVNVDLRGIPRSEVRLLRLHDELDADLVAQVQSNRYRVDPATQKVVIIGPYLLPEMTVTPLRIRPNGTDVAVVRYTGPEPSMEFEVNRVPTGQLPLTNGVVEFEVTASVAGPVIISMEPHSIQPITVTAEA